MSKLLVNAALCELQECGFVESTMTGRLLLTSAGVAWCQGGCQFDHAPDAFDLEVAAFARSLYQKSVHPIQPLKP